MRRLGSPKHARPPHGKGSRRLFDGEPAPALSPVVHCPLPVARCPMPDARCPMPVARCLLPIARCLLPVARCPFPLPVFRFPLPVFRFPLPVFRFPLPVARCPLPVARRPLRAGPSPAPGPARWGPAPPRRPAPQAQARDMAGFAQQSGTAAAPCVRDPGASTTQWHILSVLPPPPPLELALVTPGASASTVYGACIYSEMLHPRGCRLWKSRAPPWGARGRRGANHDMGDSFA